MAYNLPPGWDPGFVLPENVADEGLERRAFVTRQMPRGTYDLTDVPDGGFVLPQYVKKEKYGQGTYTTKWQPDGTYNGPGIPHFLNRRPRVVASRALPGGGRKFTVQPAMGLGADDPIPPAFQNYGARAAQVIIQRVSRVPANQRAAVMKATLDQIDKSLWTRTNEWWKQLVAAGTSPGDAFPLALARALSSGFSAEVVRLGARRAAPQASSLLGLGCYTSQGALRGRVGLGIVTAADQKTQKTIANPLKNSGIITAIQTAYKPVTYTPTQADLDAKAAKIVSIGGFPFNKEGGFKTWSGYAAGAVQRDGWDSWSGPPGYLATSPNDLTPAQIDTLRKFLYATDAPVTDNEGFEHYNYGPADESWKTPDAEAWFTKMGIDQEQMLARSRKQYLHFGFRPVARTTDPADGGPLGLYVVLAPMNALKPWAPDNPLVLKAWLSKIAPKDIPWWQTVLETIVNLPLTLDVTGITQGTMDVLIGAADKAKEIHDDIRDKIHEITCEILHSAEGEAAGAGVAAYYGAPPQVGVAGVRTGASLCGGGAAPVAPPVVPIVPPQSSMTPLLLIGGAVVAGAVIFSRKRKP